MNGWVSVMEPAQYQRRLSGAASGGTLADAGGRLFASAGCETCHRADGQGQGPPLEGIFGRTVQLQDGTTIVADEGYVRESILRPMAKVVRGYQPVMPTFEGVIDEEGVLQLIAYIKSLRTEAGS